jgi:outer membrane receptor protein involved in Fe transport
MLDDWNTLDLSLSKELKLPKTGPLTFRFSVRNVTDCRYEVSSGYPMPGRSFIGGVEYRF